MNMKLFSIKLLIPLVFISFLTVIGQSPPLKDIRFEEGGYSLVGIFAHHKDHPLQTRLGEFYTDDILVLNSIKKAWTFRRPSPQHACGYHYYISILRDGVSVKSYAINLECHEIATESGSFIFPDKLLEALKPDVKKLYRRYREFDSIAAARNYWLVIRSDKDLVFADKPRWLDFEGTFGFVYKCPDNCPSFSDRDKYTEIVKAQISQTYSGSQFELRQNGGTSHGEVFFEIQSDRNFYDKFDLYKLDRDSYFGGKWKPHALDLYSFWKTEHDVPKR